MSTRSEQKEYLIKTGEPNPTQIQMLDALINRFKLIVVPGDVRAGKTVGAIMCMILHQAGRSHLRYIVGGQSVATATGNMEYLFEDIAKQNNFHYRYEKGMRKISWVESNSFEYYGHKNADTDKQIAGGTFAGGIIDEASFMHPNFYYMAMSRFSGVPDPVLILTMNPGGRQHWVKRQIIDQIDDIGGIYMHANIEDNEQHLPEGFAEQVGRTLTGHYKKRMLEGEWASATGVVYPEYQVVEQPDTSLLHHVWGVDYGESGVTAAVKLMGNGMQYQAQGEYYHHGASDGIFPPSVHVQRMLDKLGRPSAAYCDPSASLMIAELQRAGVNTYFANNDVLEGIQAVHTAFTTGTLTIHECNYLQDELAGYEWREITDSGIEAPVKKEDHLCDALRYVTQGVLPLQRSLIQRGIVGL